MCLLDQLRIFIAINSADANVIVLHKVRKRRSLAQEIQGRKPNAAAANRAAITSVVNQSFPVAPLT